MFVPALRTIFRAKRGNEGDQATRIYETAQSGRRAGLRAQTWVMRGITATTEGFSFARRISASVLSSSVAVINPALTNVGPA